MREDGGGKDLRTVSRGRGTAAQKSGGKRSMRRTSRVTTEERRLACCPTEQARFVEHLFARYRHALLSYLCGLLARRADAEDVLQETCARLLKVETLDRTLGRARAYMFKVATNLAYDRFRCRAEVSLEAAEAPELASDAESPEAMVDFAQGLAIVEKAILELKPRCRFVFLLRAGDGLSYEAIADRLGISKRTVEREMQHALEVCQIRLKRARE